MGKAVNLVGQMAVGRLTVIRLSDKRLPVSGKKGRERGWTLPLWECECSCGNPEIVLVTTARLHSGNTRSCGCIQREEASRTGKTASSHAREKQCQNPNCGIMFLGTNKQVYCSRTCKEACAVKLPPKDAVARERNRQAAIEHRRRKTVVKLKQITESLESRNGTADRLDS